MIKLSDITEKAAITKDIVIAFIKKWTKLSTWQDYLLPENPQEHIRMVRFLVVTLILMVIGISFAFMVAFSIVKTGSPKTRVPNVSRHNVLDAINILQSENFRVRFETRYDNKYPMHEVIRQHPRGGVIAREGREITLTVSLGRDVYEVPKICGLPRESALEILKERKIPYTIQTVPAAANESETVMAMNMQPGEHADRNISLIVTISEKKESDSFEMEDFGYQPIEYVVTTLYNNHINPILVSSNVESNAEDGLVLGQNIAPGEKLGKNSSVIITVGLNAQDTGERTKLRWYAINFHIPKAQSSGQFEVIVNEQGETNEIITPDAPTARFYKALLEDEIGRAQVIYEKQGAEGTSFVRAFKAYGKAKLTVFADDEIIAERSYNNE
ncbi:MAG: PASTA domain-containing protein [Brevinema sp.]